jgi:hypothetical protein
MHQQDAIMEYSLKKSKWYVIQIANPQNDNFYSLSRSLPQPIPIGQLFISLEWFTVPT